MPAWRRIAHRVAQLTRQRLSSRIASAQWSTTAIAFRPLTSLTHKSQEPHRMVAHVGLDHWQVDAQASGAAAADRCKSDPRPPPATAFCIAGSARSFGTPLVQVHMRHNLLTALGGSDQSRLFLHLKLLDSAKNTTSSGQKFKQHTDVTLDNLLASLRLPWISKRLAEAVIVNGSGSIDPRAAGCKTASPTCIMQPNPRAWRDYRLMNCLRHPDDDKYPNTTMFSGVTPDGHKQGTCCPPSNSFVSVSNNEERQIMQHLGIGWCGHAVPRYESARGQKFDLVVYARPDLIWWSSVQPWCTWKWTDHMIGCEGPMCDMVWMVPRRHFHHLSRQHEMHRDCPAAKAPARSKYDRAACCTTSEHLLTFARSHRNATHLVPKHLQLPLSNVSTRVTKAMSVLRFVRGVCDIVMSPKLNLKGGYIPASAKAGRYAFFQQTWNAMLLSTQLRVRYLFVRNESGTGRTKNKTKLGEERAACDRALAWYGSGSTIDEEEVDQETVAR